MHYMQFQQLFEPSNNLRQNVDRLFLPKLLFLHHLPQITLAAFHHHIHIPIFLQHLVQSHNVCMIDLG